MQLWPPYYPKLDTPHGKYLLMICHIIHFSHNFEFRLSEVDDISISLSGVCLQGGCCPEDKCENSNASNMGVMWRHSKEKPIWPQNDGKCICVPNTAGEKKSHIGVSYSHHDPENRINTTLLHYGAPSVKILYYV